MKLICPYCGLKGTAKDHLLGRKVRCPECQKIIEVTEDVAIVTADVLAASSLAEDACKNTEVEVESVKMQVPQVEVELAEGVEICSECGFAFSEQYMKKVKSERVCVICAG